MSSPGGAALTGGAIAVLNGKDAADMIHHLLAYNRYRQVKAKSLDDLLAQRKGLFPETGCYARECNVHLQAPYHNSKRRTARVDFVIVNKDGDVVLLSIKSQTSDGTAEQKLEYEIRQLIATELPSAMFVFGPIKGETHPTGFTREVLEQIWERTRYDGGNRVFLFRDPKKLEVWFADGLPVPGRGTRSQNIFMKYCDLEP